MFQLTEHFILLTSLSGYIAIFHAEKNEKRVGTHHNNDDVSSLLVENSYTVKVKKERIFNMKSTLFY